MNTILFLDGSPISLFLLKLIQKNKFFIIKKIITSTNINNFDKLINKNNISIFRTNFKNKSKNINLGKYDIGFSYYDFKIPKYVLDTIKKGGINFEEALKEFANNTSLGRMATEDDVANTALYLGSSLASSITGDIIPVSSGLIRLE